ncbi:MAG TPA: family 20 glycosylhydrolase [Opitutales bacterium]|nr:family 20 glycosylhydrolase [Opitutales bacterium]
MRPNPDQFFLWPPPKLVERTRGAQRVPKAGPKICTFLNPALAAEAYELEITTRYSSLVAGSARGLAHGLTTFDQLRKQCGDVLPCLRIEDTPDFPVRGFMLDISRGKVPSNEALRVLVRQLAALKYNHLQLYTEHTFAFRKHQRVWRDADPLTPDDLAKLQRLCDENGIELSANFNSFGHFEQWLKHPPYRQLAECPRGFTHPLKGRVPHGTTLRPSDASLRFLDKLWAEYLPHFQSPRFNVGGDEPWELGLGWSKARVKKFGKHRVYLNFLKKLHAQAARHGRQMLFWADILLEAPELVDEVPADATALLWGYEANHPFAEQCARLAAAQRKFWVCPGTSAWNTFTGRTDNMLANLASAAKHGRAHGAEGLLLTSWGDGGNHQPWPIMYPGIAYAAGLAWNQKAAKRADVARAVDLVFSQKLGSGYGDVLLQLGRIENPLKHPLPNRSRHFNLFFATRAQLKKELATLTTAELDAVVAAMDKCREKLYRLGEKYLWEFGALGELDTGLDMASWAIHRALFAKTKKNPRLLKAALPPLIERFMNAWANRAREGGLRDSVLRLADIGRELR